MINNNWLKYQIWTHVSKAFAEVDIFLIRPTDDSQLTVTRKVQRTRTKDDGTIQIADAPRIAFAFAGVVGGIFGCWFGTHIVPAFNDGPTRFLSRIEYERLCWIHLRYSAIMVMCSGLDGMIVGLGLHCGRAVRR